MAIAEYSSNKLVVAVIKDGCGGHEDNNIDLEHKSKETKTQYNYRWGTHTVVAQRNDVEASVVAHDVDSYR